MKAILAAFGIALLLVSWGVLPCRGAGGEVKAQMKRLESGVLSERVDACIQLGRMGRKAVEAIPALIGLLGDARQFRSSEPETIRLSSRGDDLAMAAAQALASIGEPAREPLLSAMKSDSPEKRIGAGFALVQLKRQAESRVREDRIALDPLVSQLKDPDSEVRASAASELGNLGDARAEEALAAALKDESARVRRAAAMSLAEIGGMSSSGPLESALEDRDAKVRADACSALGRIVARTAFAPDKIVALLAARARLDSDPEVRRSALQALSMIRFPRFLEPFVVAASDENPVVRGEAIEILGWTRDSRVLDALRAALKDADPGVRMKAARALEELKAAGITSSDQLDKPIGAQWVARAMQKIATIRPGMTRADLLKVFKVEGGLSTGLKRTYAYDGCPYIKVDVEFTAVGRPERDASGRVTLVEDPKDLIKSVSKPYLESMVAD